MKVAGSRKEEGQKLSEVTWRLSWWERSGGKIWEEEGT